MQEVSPDSFEEDFAFMKEVLGFDGVEMFKRGRFRPATFWKKSKCDLVSTMHKDRTLLTAFHLDLPSEHAHSNKVWHVLNCHLQAGPQGPRRVRQIDEGVSASFKLAKRLKEEEPRDPLLIVCGDFNGGDECGAVRYLENGGIGPSFIEDGAPVASREKPCPMSQPLTDVSTFTSRPSPPTLVVAELISQMVKDESSAYEDPELSEDCIDRLTRCFNNYATQIESHGVLMNIEDTKKWLVDINKEVGRGSEYRSAAREMGWTEPEQDGNENTPKEKPRITLPKDGLLTLNGFLNVYQAELRGGKFWGIAYDLSVMGETLPSKGLFSARFDRMYCTTKLRPTAVLNTEADKACPNESEPSDHLPVGATFSIE